MYTKLIQHTVSTQAVILLIAPWCHYCLLFDSLLAHAQAQSSNKQQVAHQQSTISPQFLFGGCFSLSLLSMQPKVHKEIQQR
jgi:hypothetical protein